jgi:hypothetical protein
MAKEKVHLKSGMGGSNNGKGRTAPTKVLKAASKKKRRKGKNQKFY